MGKKDLIEKMNEAFASCDLDFLVSNVTEDIKWDIVGEDKLSGLDEFREQLEKMKENGPMDITVNDIIIDDDRAVVEGIFQLKEPGKRRRFAFCDVYVFKKDKNKVRELRTYVTKMKRT
ncbi:nuclear transport factor 2 family protein [Christiangramia fulva]|nr:nuclear transport factor 2 family protein [Christiangramia fulva]